MWILLTVWAAFFQTVRNAAQRHLVAGLGTLGATLVRFLYGLPFAVAWLALVLVVDGHGLPAPNVVFVAWATVGAVAQILATALLLRVMTERNFAVGVAYSKTELLQVAVFGATLLGDPLSASTLIAVVLGTVAIRVPGQRLDWDPSRLKIQNYAEANRYLSRTYRDGWHVGHF